MNTPSALPLALAVALLLGAASAAAYAQPGVYFLVDDPTAPTPFTDGVLEPYDQEANNFPSSNTSTTRTVVVGQENFLPVRFIGPEEADKAGWRIQPASFLPEPLLYVWTDKSVVVHGNLTATLLLLEDGVPTVLSVGSAALDMNQSNVPDPANLVPPDPTNPDAVVAHVLAQVLPLVLVPPLIITMEPVDTDIPDGARLAIEFSITQGSSPLPVPAGLFATLQYDAWLSPSLLFVPWYAPDPVIPTPTASPTTPGDTTESSPTASDETDSGGDKGSPGLAPLGILAVLGFAALAARRRLK